MSADEEVEVLYDYSYSDDQGLVEIRKGDVYRLLEKTNSEWWHVYLFNNSQPDSEVEGFFVPAKYVRIRNRMDQEVDRTISMLDDILVEESAPNVSHSKDQSQIQRDTTALMTSSVNGMGKSTDSDGDYVNLDQYRADAKVFSPVSQNINSKTLLTSEPDYANLPFEQKHLHHLEQLPQLKDGHFVRVLVNDLPWDVYEDQSNRLFFHNRETGELTWKPPRKEKASSPENTGSFSSHSILTKEPFSNFTTGTVEEDQEEVYSKTEENGDVFFLNNSTKEKWQKIKDAEGRNYYHRLGSTDVQWDLPTSSRSKSEANDNSRRNGEALKDMNRQSKSKSMYDKIETTQDHPSDPKTSTLPSNFSPLSQDQLTGYLNKTKLTDMGKKKVKKNWINTYVVLNASNLVFYKDQKSSVQKQGSPFGKPEGVISLQGAKVDFNPPKDVTSRRNTILVSVNSGSQFLLHSDDEITIHEWLVRLKMAANDIGQESSAKELGGSLGKSGFGRSLSDGGSNQGGEAGAERRNLQGIRAKLLNFLIRRPTQEDLIKQGIIKDAVFGSSLQDLCDRDKSAVPNFILECISAVEAKGLEHDGLYRISGNLAEIQKLRYVVDKDDDYELLDEKWDIHTLTGALKLFFRELKEPLFPLSFIDKFIEAIKKDNRKEKLKAFKEVLFLLPKCNLETMRVLFQHLKNVVQFSTENRMQTQNVAIVFGPTLMWFGEEDFTKMAILTLYQSKVVEFILLEYENIFR